MHGSCEVLSWFLCGSVVVPVVVVPVVVVPVRFLCGSCVVRSWFVGDFC